MECPMFAGDPPLMIECLGCDFAHLPGMLCREQRTALTTARALRESRRDLGQVALRLSVPTGPALSAQIRRRSLSPCCDISTPTLYPASSIFDNSGHFNSVLTSSLDSCGLVKDSSLILPSDKFPPNSFKSSSSKWSSPVSQKKSSHKHLRYYSPKLSEVFVWLCLLGLMHPMTARAAPTRHPSNPSQSALSARMEQQNGTPRWINPCGMGTNDEIVIEDGEMPSVSDKELLNQIVIQAKNALWKADAFKEDYVKKTFKVAYDEHHTSWKHNHYDWLPSSEDIPKGLGDDVPEAHLEKIQNNLDDSIADSYEYLQRFAVGLEQVARDQRSSSGLFKDQFNEAENKLRAVLCEIQVAIIERNIVRRPDITRDIMSEEFRSLSGSSRNLRDWFIFRDYMNALEYVIKIFEYVSSKMP